MAYQKLQAINVRLKNEDLIALCQDTLLLIHNFDKGANVLLLEMEQVLDNALQNFTQKIYAQKSSRLTPKIKFLDQERDKNWSKIKRAIAFVLKLGNLNNNESAKTIDEFLKPYGNVRNLPFDKQTQAIRIMMKALKKNKQVKKAIGVLDLMPFFEELDHLNEQFDSLFVQRQIEHDEETQPMYKEARQELALIYIHICTHIEHLINFSKDKNKVLSKLFQQMDHLRYKSSKKYF